MSKSRICIFFSDTGGGHRSAAEAIESAINEILSCERPYGCEIEVVVENIVEKSHPLNRRFVEIYNYLLRHNQALMKYYYWLIETFKPNDSELGYKLAKPYLVDLLHEHNSSVVVSVHPMCNQYLARTIQDMGRKGATKLVTVVTDPNGNFWRGWASPGSDLTIVPNQLSRDRLLNWGIHKDRVQVVGMPINPDFTKPASCAKEDFLTSLGLNPEALTICINAGWAGGGNMIEIYRAMQAVKRPLQVIFLCGHNQRLYDMVKRESRKSLIPTAVLPFHDRMSDLMANVDLMISKAGGLTSFEAIARKLPMAIDMITNPMPQELGTVGLLVDNKLAYPIKRPNDIVSIVEEFQPVERATMKLPTTQCLDQTDAIYNIGRSVLGLCDPTYTKRSGPPRRDHTAIDLDATGGR